jgi:hypothetical protein
MAANEMAPLQADDMRGTVLSPAHDPSPELLLAASVLHLFCVGLARGRVTYPSYSRHVSRS